MLDKRPLVKSATDLEYVEKKCQEVKENPIVNREIADPAYVLGFDKVAYHPEHLVALKNGASTFPVTATLSLGNYCNHGCLWCSTAFFQEEKAASMDANLLVAWLRMAKNEGLRGVGYVGNGEPLAHKRFGFIASEASMIGLDQGIFTNGYLIDRHFDILNDAFTYIRISLDAGSPEIHSELHDVPLTHFGKILENVEKLIQRRGNKVSPTIGVQFATHQRNVEDINSCAKICSAIGVDYLSIKPVFDRGSVGTKIEKNTLSPTALREYVNFAKQWETESFKILFREHQIEAEYAEQNLLNYDKCLAAHFGVNIYEGGEITACGPHHVSIGDLSTDPAALKQNILDATRSFDLKSCPAGCRYHGLNHKLHKIINADKYRLIDHTNMI